MKVTFDEEGYLEFLSTTGGELPNAIELPDDNTLNYKYLNCYKLNDEGNGLILDAAKVQMIEQNLTAASKIAELKKRLAASDYKILRQQRENSLGITSFMTEKEYLLAEAERESIARQIREIEEGVSLTTDVASILAEGEKVRNQKKLEKKEISQSMEKIADMQQRMDKAFEKMTNGDFIKELAQEVLKHLNLGNLFGNNSNESENENEESGNTGTNSFLDKLKALANGKDNSDVENEATEEVETTEETE